MGKRVKRPKLCLAVPGISECDPAAVARVFDAMFDQIVRLKKELALYVKWAAAVDKWHTGMCLRLGIEPVHPCTRSGRPIRAAKRKVGG